MFNLKIRSRNGSAAALRQQVQSPKRGVYRCGSFTPNNEIFSESELSRGIIEINTVEANKVSNNKVLMKTAFIEHDVKTAPWLTIENVIQRLNDHEDVATVFIAFPWIIKHIHSSQGNGIYLIRDMDEFNSFILDANHRRNHIVEHYYTYVREYRLHVDKFGCFCANRKMLRENAEVRWHRHHSNSNWIREDNELFNRPSNWDDIVAEAQKARRACGLDICSVDIKVQSSANARPKFFILETNAGSALGEQTTPLYIQELTRIAEEKSRGIEEDFSTESNQETSEVAETPQLTEEELQVVQQVQNSVDDMPISVTTVDTQIKTKTTKECPGEFEMCSHIIWSGEDYGKCDLNHRKCRVFNINLDDLSTNDDDEDDDDYYDDEAPF